MKKLIFLIIILALFIGILAQHYDGERIYIWDNDGGKDFVDPDDPQGEKRIGFEANFIKAFESVGFKENIVVSEDFPSRPEDFSAIFIVAGDRQADGTIFKLEQVQMLIDYLENWHGCLYMEGNNIIEDLDKIGATDFLKTYFNIVMTSPGEGYAGYDSIRTDTTCDIFRDYTIVYPAGTQVDYNIDEFGPSNPEDTFYHSVMVYDVKQKMYKSTAAAYTPPDDKKEISSKFRTYMSAIDFGAFAAPHRKYETLPDSIENQLIREAYLRDIMRLFSIGKVLVVNHSMDDTRMEICKALEKRRIPFDNIYVEQGKNGPSYEFYSNYAGVIWYSHNNDKYMSMLQYDIDQLQIYMDYGGAVVLSGEHILFDIGNSEENTEILFLSSYFGVDYLGGTYLEQDEYGDPSGMYGKMYDFPLSDKLSSDVFKVWRFAGTTDPSMYHLTSMGKAPVLSGVVNKGGGYRTSFMSFAAELINDDAAMDQFVAITATDLFEMDTLFALHTGVNEINVSYTQYDNAVSFRVNIDTDNNGSIVLERNGQEEMSVPTISTQDNYTLKSQSTNGLYVIGYYENNNLVNSFSVSISGRTAMDEKVYMIDNIMYIESAAENTAVQVFDITGQFVENIEVSGNTRWDNYSIMPSGIYFVKFNDSGNVHKVLKY